MDNLPRFSVYISGTLVISAAFTLFTAELLFKIADPTWVGTAFLVGFGLVYMNIVFVVSRRFMRRLEGSTITPYLFAAIVGLFPDVWIFIYTSPLDSAQRIVYAVVMVVGCVLGAYFGHKAGLKSQIIFRQKLEEYLRNTGQLSEDENLSSKNLN